MSLNIKNKIVLITGASSGIGQAAAKQFAAKGIRLILTARRLERLEQLAAELKATYNVDVLSIQLDVRDKAQVKSMIQNLPEKWKEIDILLNNAGLALDSVPIQEGDIDHWDTMINTNIQGLLYMTRAILPGMIKRNTGHIINIGSVER